MEIKEMAIDELIPADYNPRVDLQEGDEDFEKLKKVIETYGFVQPVVLNSRTGNIVGGHQRTKVAKSLGYKTVPVQTVDLDEADEMKLNLALNKVSGKWDEQALGQMLNDLQSMDADLELTGFDLIEIEELTMAFADVDLDNLEVDFNGGEYNPDENEDEDYNPMDDEDERGYVIQYNIVFDDEVQQETWHSFLKMLKDKYDNDAFPSHASRIHAFIMKEGLNKVKGDNKA